MLRESITGTFGATLDHRERSDAAGGGGSTPMAIANTLGEPTGDETGTITRHHDVPRSTDIDDIAGTQALSA